MKQKNTRLVHRVKRYEKVFSAHKYTGKGKKYIETISGKLPVAIMASQAVDHLTEEGRMCPADTFSGGLTKILAQDAGCGAVYLRKTCPKQELPEITSTIAEFLKCNDTRVFIDFQVMDSDSENVVQLFSDISEGDQKYAFIRRAIQYSFEYEYRDINQGNTVGDAFGNKCSIAAKAAQESNVAYMCIKLNKYHCNPFNQDEFVRLYKTLLKITGMLSKLDWKAEHIEAYRLWQSAAHKPQDKVELSAPNGEKAAFAYNSLLNICTYGSGPEKVRLHKPGEKTINKPDKNDPNFAGRSEKEYIFLTNRLIELLFGREWIEGREEVPGLMGAPVILYENVPERYPIGLPKANHIDGIFFSSALFADKREEAKDFDYVIFNRYTDSRLHIDFEKAHYGDFGRVKDSSGMQAKKVMIPRYYKRLLGYLDTPLEMIRSEEYEGIIAQLKKEEENAESEEDKSVRRAERESFESCYEKIDGEIFHSLKKDLNRDNTETERSIKNVTDVQKRYGIFDNVELSRVPKEVKQKQRLYHILLSKLDWLKIWILKKAIGKAEYLLKTNWASETDDRNNIARLSPNMMSLLGVSENDKILVKFGKKHEILRVLAKEELTDYQIGIPAPARKRLGMNSINDIVIVHRDMVYIFQRHSEQQTIAILGTVLAVYQVFTQVWLGVILCLLLVPLIMYFVLNEERIKVK